jgi:hypothetical protein
MTLETFPCPRCRPWISGGSVCAVCLTIYVADVFKPCPSYERVCMSMPSPVSIETPHIEVMTGSTSISVYAWGV